MAAKSIIAGEYILQIADNGHVDVMRVFRNAKQTMREIAASKNFEVKDKWTTQVLGRHLVIEFGDGKTVKFDDITINRLPSGQIEIFQECKNTKAALREISGQLGFEYDKDWTTQQFGAKLEKYLSEHKEIADKVLQTPNRRRACKVETHVVDAAPAAAPAEEKTTLIEHLLEDFIVEDADANYLYDSMMAEEDEKTLFIDNLHALNEPKENEILDKLTYTGADDLIAYLEEDPDELNLAYKIVCAAYATFNGYDIANDDPSLYEDTQWYMFEDGMDLQWNYETDIDLG